MRYELQSLQGRCSMRCAHEDNGFYYNDVSILVIQFRLVVDVVGVENSEKNDGINFCIK